jgi:hypothetical protein
LNSHLEIRNVFVFALIAFSLLVSAFLALAPKASANKSDCPVGTICFWEGPTFGGNRAFFTTLGFKSLANINPRSAYDNTSNGTVVFSETTPVTLFAGQSYSERPFYFGTITIAAG